MPGVAATGHHNYHDDIHLVGSGRHSRCVVVTEVNGNGSGKWSNKCICTRDGFWLFLPDPDFGKVAELVVLFDLLLYQFLGSRFLVFVL